MNRSMLVRLAVILALMMSVGCSASAGQPTLAKIADMVDQGHGDEAEPLLLKLHEANPDDAEVLTQLARIEYLRATWGRAQPASGFPMNWDPAHMDAAERWAEQAVAANPGHANAWVAYGQIKNARMQPAESLTMLERAESLDPTSVKLRLRKGATLRALSEYRGDKSLLAAAALEYGLAIKGAVDDGNELLAAQDLAHVYGDLGQHEKAQETLAKALEFAKGNQRAFLLDNRANAYLQTGQIDLALADSRAALNIVDFGVGRSNLARGLLVKAGLYARDGADKDAASFLQQALETGVSPQEALPTLASMPGTFPAIYALLMPDAKAQGGDRLAASVIGNSAWFVSADDLKRLDGLGVDFGSVDEHFGTLLHRAIQNDNVDAVRTLLDLGVETSIRHPNGSTLLETTLVGTSAKRREVRRMVVAKVGAPKGWKDPGVDLPVKGRWYLAERPIGVVANPGDKVMPAGTMLLSGGPCWSTETPAVCMTFYSQPGIYFGTVMVPLASVEDLKALREIPAPTTPAPSPAPQKASLD